MQLEDLPPKLQEQAKRKLGIINTHKNKFNATKTSIGGHTFDSKAEAEHYANLKLLEKAGVIQNLELQPRFLLQDGFMYQGHHERKIEYVADFRYQRDGRTIVEDVKGVKTDVYKLKRKLFLHKYGDEITFREVSDATNQS